MDSRPHQISSVQDELPHSHISHNLRHERRVLHDSIHCGEVEQALSPADLEEDGVSF